MDRPPAPLLPHLPTHLAARVELRMHLFERCAALVIAELEAREGGDRSAAEAIRAERDDLRGAWEHLATAPGAPVGRFADALDGATTELAHREEVDARLREHLLALGAAAARRLPPAGPVGAPRGAPHGRSYPHLSLLLDGGRAPDPTLNVMR